MDTIIFEDSAKNIPVASERAYKEISIISAEKFMRNITWRCIHWMINLLIHVSVVSLCFADILYFLLI